MPGLQTATEPFANASSLTSCTYTPGTADIAAGTVTLTLTAVDDLLCPDAVSTKVLTILPSPEATAGGSTIICQNQTATVTGASALNGTILWTTSNGGGNITNPTTTSPVYNAVAADAGKAIILTMTVSSGSCTPATAIYTVNVNGLPTASAGGSKTICLGGTALVSGASSTNGTILWTHSG